MTANGFPRLIVRNADGTEEKGAEFTLEHIKQLINLLDEADRNGNQVSRSRFREVLVTLRKSTEKHIEKLEQDLNLLKGV